VDLTTAAVAREILERDTVLKAQAGAKDVSYQQSSRACRSAR